MVEFEESGQRDSTGSAQECPFADWKATVADIGILMLMDEDEAVFVLVLSMEWRSSRDEEFLRL